MRTVRHYLILFFLPLVVVAQDADLPPDFRQHNLSEYNSSLLDPVFSLDRSEERALALWTRWQWQTIDGDPTTLLFNYTHRLNRRSAGGFGLFQNNTTLFQQTGALVNYAYHFDLGGGAGIALGANLFGYQQKPQEEAFQPNPDIPLPQFGVSNAFVMQFAPSVRFQYNQFSAGITGENFVHYNFSTKERESGASSKIYLGHLSYRIPLFIFGTSEDTYLEPMVYMKSIPVLNDQYGLSGTLYTQKFWAQLGYNSFYGVAGGVGGHFFKHFSVGALVEFGSENSIDGNGTSIEFVTAYSFGKADLRHKIVGFEEEEEIPVETEVASQQEEEESALAARERDSVAAERREQEEIAKLGRERDSMALAHREAQEQRAMDSIATVRREAALLAERNRQEAQKRDSLLQAEARKRELAMETVTPAPGEKYEEVKTEDGLQPGYYLIANVFGTKKYFDAFMKTLSEKGLQPKSFFRSANKYNYVYLERYDSIDAARAARDSRFGGKYADNTWIFRVVAN